MNTLLEDLRLIIRRIQALEQPYRFLLFFFFY